jgi:hypothetical protein
MSLSYEVEVPCCQYRARKIFATSAWELMGSSLLHLKNTGKQRGKTTQLALSAWREQVRMSDTRHAHRRRKHETHAL